MLPEYANNEISEMKDTEEKQLLSILKEKAKPFVKKCDGYAAKIEEDTQIEYKDWENNERTLKVPAGSYITVDEGCHYPKVITASDWESKNKFIDDEAPKMSKKDNSPKIGISLMSEENY